MTCDSARPDRSSADDADRLASDDPCYLRRIHRLSRPAAWRRAARRQRDRTEPPPG